MAAALKRQFLIWRTITLGTYKTVGMLREALVQSNFSISGCASEIFGKIVLASEAMQVELVKTTGAKLGQTENENLDQICVRAMAQGLDQCPAEVGPQLRLQYPDQPLGEVVWIAMEPLTSPNNNPFVFRVAHDEDGQWLRTGYESRGYVWRPDLQWIFVRSPSTFR